MRPHDDQPVLHAGEPIESAHTVVLLIHGRGGSAEDFLALSRWIDKPDLAYLAPQASGNTWYPYSFLAPIERNQPGIDSGIAKIESIVSDLSTRGVPSERIVLVGFSQGACLTCEFVARHPRRYGGVAAIIGGLIGPPGTPRDYPGSLDRTPIYLAGHDPDPHVPFTRVVETRDVFVRMSAAVDLQHLPRKPHMLLDEHIDHVRTLLASI